MSHNAVLNINLTPIITYDEKVNKFVIYYEELPEAIASGSDIDEASKNLAYLVEDMWIVRSKELKEYLLKNHNSQIIIQTKSANQEGIL